MIVFEISRYEARKRRRGSAALTGGVIVFALLLLSFFPSFETVDLDEYVEAFPPAVREFFGIAALDTVEGFLAVEVYQFIWVLLLGLYFAYLGAGLIASDVERGRMDLLLALPVSRARVVGEKFASLLLPILAINLFTPFAVYLGIVAIGDSIDPVSLAMVHLLSIPYFLICAAIGLALSTAIHRVDVAQRVAIVLVFALFLFETVAAMADYDLLSALSPAHHYDPTAILVEGSYDLVGAGILLVASIALVIVGAVWFRRVDVE